MENPLAQIVAVEDRTDGVYITIPREKKGELPLEKFVTLIENAHVTNYDPDAINDVLLRARGAPEKIGPSFEYFDRTLLDFVAVRVSKNQAVMRISPDIVTAALSLTSSNIRYCLKEKGIIFGILPEAISNALRDNTIDNDVVVAMGKEPVRGTDAQVVWEVALKNSQQPHTRRDGSANFREIDSYTQVNQGQVIARKVPLTSGEPGKLVTGEIVPAEPGKDIELHCGNNISISSDGLSLVADKAGVLKHDGQIMSISERLIFNKDVDFSVGNIKFIGDVDIAGDVKPGFSVEAEGDICIQGIVESAKITSRNGTVTIMKGVIGKSDVHIFAKKKIVALFAQEAILETEGIIQIERHCLNCTCICEGFEGKNQHFSLIGGNVSAFNFVDCATIGNEKGIDTKIVIKDRKKNEAKLKLGEYQKLADSVIEQLEPIKKQVSTKAAIFKKAGTQVTDRQKTEMKKWIDAYNVLNLKLTRIREKIDEQKKQMDGPHNLDGVVKVSGSVFPGTILDFYGMRKVIQQRKEKILFNVTTLGEIGEGHYL